MFLLNVVSAVKTELKIGIVVVVGEEHVEILKLIFMEGPVDDNMDLNRETVV
jgi:hypothetical protein